MHNFVLYVTRYFFRCNMNSGRKLCICFCFCFFFHRLKSSHFRDFYIITITITTTRTRYACWKSVQRVLVLSRWRPDTYCASRTVTVNLYSVYPRVPTQFFSPDWGMLEGLDAFRFFFNSTGGIIMCPQVVFYITLTI